MFKKVAKKAEGTRKRMVSSDIHDEEENFPPIGSEVSL